MPTCFEGLNKLKMNVGTASLWSRFKTMTSVVDTEVLWTWNRNNDPLHRHSENR